MLFLHAYVTSSLLLVSLGADFLDFAWPPATQNTKIRASRTPFAQKSAHRAAQWAAQAKVEVAPGATERRFAFFWAGGATSVFGGAAHCAAQWGAFFVNGAPGATAP